jgi:hypothetical protein
MVDKAKSERPASVAFKDKGAAVWALAAQIDDSANAAVAHSAQLERSGLARAPVMLSHLKPVAIQQSHDPVIYHRGLDIGPQALAAFNASIRICS